MNPPFAYAYCIQASNTFHGYVLLYTDIADDYVLLDGQRGRDQHIALLKNSIHFCCSTRRMRCARNVILRVSTVCAT